MVSLRPNIGNVLLYLLAIIGLMRGDDLNCPKNDDSECDCQIISGIVSLDCTGKDFIGLPSLLNLQVKYILFTCGSK